VDHCPRARGRQTGVLSCSRRTGMKRLKCLAHALGGARDGAAGMTAPEPSYPPLSTREIGTLPEGARVIETWSEGNDGPHEYRVHWSRGEPYAQTDPSPARYTTAPWRGVGAVAARMARQGYDLQLTRYDQKGWRATFYRPGWSTHPRARPARVGNARRGGPCRVQRGRRCDRPVAMTRWRAFRNPKSGSIGRGI